MEEAVVPVVKEAATPVVNEIPSTEGENVVAPVVKDAEVASAVKDIKETPAPAAGNATAVAEPKPEESTPEEAAPLNYLKSQKPRKSIRLVKGFRAKQWRPRLKLDEQKDVANKLRKKLFTRHNKYVKFVDIVLGKPSAVESEKKPVGTVKGNYKYLHRIELFGEAAFSHSFKIGNNFHLFRF